MFFRKWREKRREKIAQQWMIEKMSLPPVDIPKLDIDEAALEQWRQEQTALHPPGEPTTALDCDADDLDAKVEALLDWQRRTAPWLKTNLESHRDTLDFHEGQRIRDIGQTFVTQAFLDGLIYTHPRPDVLLRHWHNQMPQLIDEVTGGDLPTNLAERHKEDALAWQAMLKHYTQLIEHAAAFYQKHREQDDDDD